MKDVREFNPNPPQPEQSLNLDEFSLKMIEMKVDSRKTGWSQFTFSIPQKVRALYFRDILHGPEWRQLMKEFDER